MHFDFEFCEIEYSKYKEEFLDAWKVAFSRKIDDSIFDWLFGGAFRNRIFVAFEKNGKKILAGYCLLELISNIKEVTVTCHLCNNVFTVPDFRHHDIFVNLGRFALSKISLESYFAFGIPNAVAIPGHKRVGWKVCEPLFFYGKKPKMEPISGNLSFQHLQPKDCKSLENISKINIAKGNIGIFKTSDFFYWRYFSRPKTDRNYYYIGLYENGVLLGYIIISHFFEKNFTHILDIGAYSPVSIDALLSYASIFSNEIGAIFLTTWASPSLLHNLSSEKFKEIGDQSNLILKCFDLKMEDKLFSLINKNGFVLGDNDVF